MSTANLDCTTAAQRMHEFLDGELEGNLRPAMERHIAGCADCSATLAQLRRLENAHHQLDAQLKPPPEVYWHTLPQQVMERVRASERRRLLALPRLPRFKSPAERVPAPNKLPTSSLPHLAPSVRAFLKGPAKYVLPLAAVATFCFFMIRELRENPAASIMTESAPMAKAPAERDEGKKESTVITPATVAEAPAKKSATAPSEPATAPQTQISLQNSSLTRVGQAGAGGGQAAGVAVTPSLGEKAPTMSNTKAGESLLGLASTTPPVVTKMGQDSLVLLIHEAKPSPQFTASSEKAKDEPAVEMEQAASPADKLEAEKGAEPVSAEETRARDDDARARSVQHYSRQPSTPGGVGISTLQKSATSASDDFGFAETLQRAQQTSDLKRRETIWRDFLKTKPDSSHRSLAIFHLAETLAAASDSTTKLEQLEKNIAYFRDNAASLRSHMGEKEFERELSRLQMLVNRRKSSPKP